MMMILYVPLMLLVVLAIWWSPVFIWKNNEKWRKRVGVFLFIVNIPLYYLMMGPAFWNQPRLLFEGIWKIVPWVGVTFLVYGAIITILHLFDKVKAGGPGYDPTRLLTEGAYRYIRHPQIAGLFMLSLGAACVGRAIYHLCISGIYLVIFCIHIIMEEEILLIPRFGEQYVTYRKQTRAFVPFLV